MPGNMFIKESLWVENRDNQILRANYQNFIATGMVVEIH